MYQVGEAILGGEPLEARNRNPEVPQVIERYVEPPSADVVGHILPKLCLGKRIRELVDMSQKPGLATST